MTYLGGRFVHVQLVLWSTAAEINGNSDDVQDAIVRNGMLLYPHPFGGPLARNRDLEEDRMTQSHPKINNTLGRYRTVLSYLVVT